MMGEDLANSSAEPARTYRLSRDARRTVLALLAGVVLIAVYALWSLGALITGGLQGPEWVSAALMLAILALSPAVAWSLLAEYNAAILTDDRGLTYRTIGGVNLLYDWSEVHPGVPTAHDEESVLHLGVDPPALERIPNPLVRLLLEQAHGGRVPLYPGLTDRADLLAAITARGRDSSLRSE